MFAQRVEISYREYTPFGTSCFADWLIERRHASKDYINKLRLVRKKLDAAVEDLPVRNDLQKLVRSKENMTYWDCLKVSCRGV